MGHPCAARFFVRSAQIKKSKISLDDLSISGPVVRRPSEGGQLALPI